MAYDPRVGERAEIQPPADGGLAQLLVAPFSPGQGPFRIKGNAYRGHLSYVDSYVPGGREAHAESLRSLSRERGEAMARYFEQNFLASAWYDVYPLALAGAACGHLTGEDFLSFVYNRSCAQARADIGGVHRFLLRFVSAKSIALRTPGLMARYVEFVTVESTAVDAYTMRSSFAGSPVALAPWLAAVMEGYITTVVEIAGNTRPRTTTTAVLATGDHHGVATCVTHAEVSLRGAEVRGVGFG